MVDGLVGREVGLFFMSRVTVVVEIKQKCEGRSWNVRWPHVYAGSATCGVAKARCRR